MKSHSTTSKKNPIQLEKKSPLQIPKKNTTSLEAPPVPQANLPGSPGRSHSRRSWIVPWRCSPQRPPSSGPRGMGASWCRLAKSPGGAGRLFWLGVVPWFDDILWWDRDFDGIWWRFDGICWRFDGIWLGLNGDFIGLHSGFSWYFTNV